MRYGAENIGILSFHNFDTTPDLFFFGIFSLRLGAYAITIALVVDGIAKDIGRRNEAARELPNPVIM